MCLTCDEHLFRMRRTKTYFLSIEKTKETKETHTQTKQTHKQKKRHIIEEIAVPFCLKICLITSNQELNIFIMLIHILVIQTGSE